MQLIHLKWLPQAQARQSMKYLACKAFQCARLGPDMGAGMLKTTIPKSEVPHQRCSSCPGSGAVGLQVPLPPARVQAPLLGMDWFGRTQASKPFMRLNLPENAASCTPLPNFHGWKHFPVGVRKALSLQKKLFWSKFDFLLSQDLIYISLAIFISYLLIGVC